MTTTLDNIDHNVISFSGGKDSTAMLLLAIERDTPDLSVVFADTGNEHEQTYDYVRYIESATGVPIRWVKADFARQIAGKREFVLTKWADKWGAPQEAIDRAAAALVPTGTHTSTKARQQASCMIAGKREIVLTKWSAKWGAPQEAIDRAAAALVPTGIPFLDLCIWKGRFPSTKVAFCSEELKRNPIIEQVQNPLLETGNVISWQGVRRNESLNRRFLTERELKTTAKNGNEMWNYRPILDWTADDCFAMHKKHGIKHNPLYEQGMGRVGCMPCINARKDELNEISKRFPEAIDRIEQWERAVSLASKRLCSTFFPSEGLPDDATMQQHYDNANIREIVKWAATARGGKQRDFFREMDGPMCSSIYGLCE